MMVMREARPETEKARHGYCGGPGTRRRLVLSPGVRGRQFSNNTAPLQFACIAPVRLYNVQDFGESVAVRDISWPSARILENPGFSVAVRERFRPRRRCLARNCAGCGGARCGYSGEPGKAVGRERILWERKRRKGTTGSDIDRATVPPGPRSASMNSA